MTDFNKINELLDFYAVLLTDKQLVIMEYYYRENYSLMEISEILSISRAAVNDAIKRSIKVLEQYEAKLQLVEKFKKRNEIYTKMLKIKENAENIQKLKNLE